MTHLTAIVLTYNEASNIKDCLATVQFADRILVFDSYSTDTTVQLAQNAEADVIQHAFENYAAQRNAALDAVAEQTDWVLFVDADERVTEELAREVRAVTSTRDDTAGYRIPRHNYIFGKLTKATGWYPDYQTRLLRVGAAHYDPEKMVHEVVVLDGPLGTLAQPFVHHNYRDLAHFADKQRRYSQYDAQVLYEKGERLKPWTLITMPMHQFRWRFATLEGYRDGWHGFFLSLLMARYEFRKYRLLGQLWRGGGARSERPR
jgi:(heptosyl)LPS beta-1,4-glucosyltransferase